MSDASVLLRVYDISRGMARTMSLALTGQQFDAIYHTGVCISLSGQKIEYFFGGGGTRPDDSGISSLPPIQFEQMFGMRPIEIINLGQTRKTNSELIAFLNTAKAQWRCGSYSLLRHNCNHFSNDLVSFLLGPGRIPDRILKQPEQFAATPLGAQFAPFIDSFTGSMQNTLESHGIVSAPPPAVSTNESVSHSSSSSSKKETKEEKINVLKEQNSTERFENFEKVATKPTFYTDSTSAVTMGQRLISISENIASKTIQISGIPFHLTKEQCMFYFFSNSNYFFVRNFVPNKTKIKYFSKIHVQ
eukprot:GSMAST32.ASY1.ANO1.1529.1 assembled CDS